MYIAVALTLPESKFRLLYIAIALTFPESKFRLLYIAVALTLLESNSVILHQNSEFSSWAKENGNCLASSPSLPRRGAGFSTDPVVVVHSWRRSCDAVPPPCGPTRTPPS